MTNSSHPFNLLTILGATASGKTRLAVALARELGGEIISADSRQVFRGMDIGTGKDLQEYGETPYHLIDILEPGDEFSVFAFQSRFFAAFNDITARHCLPILCGGTGLYLDAVLRGYRMHDVAENQQLREALADKSDAELVQMLCELVPSQHNTSDLTDRQRTIRAIEIVRYQQQHEPVEQEKTVSLMPLVIGIRWERSTLRRRITERLQQRLADGLIEEVQQLHTGGVSWERLDYYGLEYRFVGRFLSGELTRNDMLQKLNAAIHDFAKRQETWYRRMERHGVQIQWVEGATDPFTESRALIEQYRALER